MAGQTRVVVTGRYVDSSTYVLYLEDGSLFQTIREGEPFTIDNQMRPWVPVKVPNKNGYGTILMCQKYRDNGDLLTQFPLIHNRKGLWALTSGAARRGVFHKYTPPKNPIEEELVLLGVNPKILEKVLRINTSIEGVGFFRNSNGYKVYTDSQEEVIRASDVCEIYDAHYLGGTYLVYTHVYTTASQVRREHVLKVLITKDCEESKLLDLLRSFER